MTDHQKHYDQKSDHTDDAALEALFAQARDTPEALSDPLLAAILADAAAVQGDLIAVTAKQAVPEARNFRPNAVAIFKAMGGWVIVSGLVAASCVGLWIGFTAHETLLSTPGLSTLIVTQTNVDYAIYETFDLASALVEDMQ